jgi:Acyl-CoA reductase (LuxC)/Acyl-protein synthetase, LuxE
MLTLLQQVLSYIDAPQPSHFESIALAVFRYQAAHVRAYHAFLTSVGIEPNAVGSLQDIPPVSTLAFKYARIENALHPESAGSHVFLTSGTSIGHSGRGHHLVPSLDIYRASAIGHLRRMMFPDQGRLAMLALHPTVERAPESSLAQMISWCIEEFGNGDALCAATRDSVDAVQAMEFLRRAQRLNRPVCILGTTASCGVLFAALREGSRSILLPVGSRLMDTGGAKGQQTPLSCEQVAAEASQLLGIEPSLVINEYGMTEMCSQLYDATSFNSSSGAPPGRRVKLAPPWLKAAALDPITLKPNADGSPGMLSFFDLANVGSISALMTEDIGIVQGDAVMVLGRASAADARGCALAVNQFAQAAGPWLSSQAMLLTPTGSAIGKQIAVASEAADSQPAPTMADIERAATRLRQILRLKAASTDPDTVGEVLHEVKEAVASGSGRWGGAIRTIAANSGYSEPLLQISLHALLAPLHRGAEFARKVAQRREVFGFIMPGNVPGGGIHELVTVLAAGCAAIVKTSCTEPVFFSELAGSLRDLDSRFGSDLGARLEIFNWSRERADLTDCLLKYCDHVIAFGDDLTIAQLERLTRQKRLIGFGTRVTVAAVMREALRGAQLRQTPDKIALDCAMFDQRGCLSPQHIFVEEHVHEFASELAAAFARLAPLLGADSGLRSFELQDGAALRRLRESARWRRLGGQDVEVWEDPNFRWTVILDCNASFVPSPGFRTVHVSRFSDPVDLECRLKPVRGRIEGFSIAGGEPPAGAAAPVSRAARAASTHDQAGIYAVARRCGATHVCAPGEIQSPPLEWPHGGGDFIRMFIG